MSSRVSCDHCGASVVDFTPTKRVIESVDRALTAGSKSLAAGEFKYFAQCTDGEATAWVNHLLSCAYAWPQAEADQAVLHQIDAAFADADKPEHFTDPTHCNECREHDETLRARTRETLQRNDVGNLGWDPIVFSSADGVGYFFPALARFALLPDVWHDNNWYAVQLLSYLAWEGSENKLRAWSSPPRRQGVQKLLSHLAITRSDAIAKHNAGEDLHNALTVWGV